MSTVVLLFLKDSNRVRKLTINSLLLGNTLLFLSPLILAYLNTPRGGNMLSENSGGAYLWLYLFIFPATAMIQLVLLILKIVFAVQK